MSDEDTYTRKDLEKMSERELYALAKEAEVYKSKVDFKNALQTHGRDAIISTLLNEDDGEDDTSWEEFTPTLLDAIKSGELDDFLLHIAAACKKRYKKAHPEFGRPATSAAPIELPANMAILGENRHVIRRSRLKKYSDGIASVRPDRTPSGHVFVPFGGTTTTRGGLYRREEFKGKYFRIGSYPRGLNDSIAQITDVKMISGDWNLVCKIAHFSPDVDARVRAVWTGDNRTFNTRLDYNRRLLETD